MIPKDAINPFRPGLGQIPPVFAGRLKEQYGFDRLIKELKCQVIPARDVIICAPRGNGKTALLNRLTRKIRNEEKGNVHVIKTTSDKIKTPAGLLNKIAAPGWIERLEAKTGLSFKIDRPGIQVESSPQTRRDQQATALGNTLLPANETAITVSDELVNEGYIRLVDPTNQYDYHPGILSLMTHISKQAQRL